MPLLFVYGTLKRGHRNHRLLAGQRFVRATETVPEFRLYDLGPFPGMVRHPDGGPVRGELFLVSGCCLDELDDFEGVPDLFTRERVELADGEEAWAYQYARPVPSGE
jgi:gamma-glutamylcyclotransferase (GGCT)/AIG2-like uncharacterized protein YtfP